MFYRSHLAWRLGASVRFDPETGLLKQEPGWLVKKRGTRYVTPTVRNFKNETKNKALRLHPSEGARSLFVGAIIQKPFRALFIYKTQATG